MVDGKKLRVAEYKQLMKSRRQEVRQLWYEAPPAHPFHTTSTCTNSRYTTSPYVNGSSVGETWRPLANHFTFFYAESDTAPHGASHGAVRLGAVRLRLAPRRTVPDSV